ncbi:MAG: hypothetical protein CMO01_08075 [Thalassobius sp.]|nr:hypothetical protein [Thalassovita sp.]
MSAEISHQIILKRTTGGHFATITVEEENNLIFIDWNGFLSVELVKEGSEELLKIFKSYQHIHKILVNNKNVSGPWSKANDWYANDWNPRAITAGLKYMAIIESENIFTQLSLKGFQKVSGGYEAQRFLREEQARNWLQSV